MGAIQGAINQTLGTAALATKLVNDATDAGMAKASAQLETARTIEDKNLEGTKARAEFNANRTQKKYDKSLAKAVEATEAKEAYTGDKRSKEYRGLKENESKLIAQSESAEKALKGRKTALAQIKGKIEATRAIRDVVDKLNAEQKAGATNIMAKRKVATSLNAQAEETFNKAVKGGKR